MTQLDFDDLFAADKYFSVKEITQDIKAKLENAFFEIRVKGEISNFVLHGSGHMYFSLKDEYAQINCVMWRGNNQRLLFSPESGLEVLIRGRLVVYEKRGNYQIDVQEMRPVGLGELQVSFEQLKAKLNDEGLFDQSCKKSLPKYPGKIGLITSSSGAAIQDFLSIVQRRFPIVEIVLNPVRVQGDEAEIEIAQALDDFQDMTDIDVLVVTRGGGSIEDLRAFNSEKVARSIFRSKIPVVSAIGHEIDFTISDFVADFRAPTPSAAAELVVPDQNELIDRINHYSRIIFESITEKIDYSRERVQNFERSYGFGRVLDRVRQSRQSIDEIQRLIHKNITHHLTLQKSKFELLLEKTTLLDHGNTLKRGYAICYYKDGRGVISSSKKLAPQDEIMIELGDGEVDAEVREVRN